MNRTILSMMLSLLLFTCLATAEEIGYDDQQNFSQRIGLEEKSAQDIFAFFQYGTVMDVGGEPKTLYSYSDVKSFYEQNAYRPAWRERRQIISLLDFIAHLEYEGLNPFNSDYNHDIIVRLLDAMDQGEGGLYDDAGKRAKLDILLTDAFMAVAYHLHLGMSYMLDLSEHHAVDKRSVDMVAILQRALARGSIEESLRALEPTHEGYLRLKAALARYIAIEKGGGWERVSMPALMTQESLYRSQESIKKRLEASDDYYANGTTPYLRDEERLKEAVMRFQGRYGLARDGVAGKQTVAAMNHSVSEVIRKIMLNMERWKWLPEYIEPEHIIVNIPDFKLRVVDGNSSVLEMKVIVGKYQRKTPTFDAEMSNLVFNPYWRIPETILQEDLLPKLKADVGYLKEKEIKIFNANDSYEYSAIDPRFINWDEMDEESIIRYKFRQEPGPQNPLGYVKFIFPNRFDVYIHDTPSKEKFDFEKTMFSSGCIRVKKPIELAAYLLKRDKPETSYKDIFDQILSGKVKGVWFKNRIHVYITYQSAWAEADGSLQLRDDIYGFDADLATLLKEKLY